MGGWLGRAPALLLMSGGGLRSASPKPCWLVCVLDLRQCLKEQTPAIRSPLALGFMGLLLPAFPAQARATPEGTEEADHSTTADFPSLAPRLLPAFCLQARAST